MTAPEAFAHFVRRTLTTQSAERFTALCDSNKGQKKLLESLCHRFGASIRDGSARRSSYEEVWERSCYAFHQTIGFGAEFASVREAYDRLELHDGWLILLLDGSAGIHRPEARWDDERLITRPRSIRDGSQ